MKLYNIVGKYFIVTLLSAIVSISYGQSAVVKVTKKECTFDKKYSGEKLIIHYKMDTISLESPIEYWLDHFINLADSSKLLIIGRLLEYENDTSICCLNVFNRSFNGIEGCGGKPKDAERYTLEVDALFMINRLCWPKLMELYSCTPVLFDSKLNRTINNDPKKVSIVFAEYKKWYAECEVKGKISKYFPFNDGRYIWYGGRKSLVSKD